MPLDDRPIFLIGFMASGKSTLGRLLAERLAFRFLDTDELVERREGRSIERIFRESGEGRFRHLEWEVLSGLDGLRECVVATGGGLFLGARERRWIKRRARTVWLDVPLAECVDRAAGAGPGRPLWRAEGPTGLQALFDRRRSTYALADLRLAAATAPAEAIVPRLVELLRVSR